MQDNQDDVYNTPDWSKNFAKGEIIIHEGAYAGKLYLIQSGRVEVFINIDGNEEVIAHLSENEFIGELSFLTGGKASASVRCLDDVELVAINDRIELRKMCVLNPDFVMNLMRSISEKLINTNAVVAQYMGMIDSMKLIYKD